MRGAVALGDGKLGPAIAFAALIAIVELAATACFRWPQVDSFGMAVRSAMLASALVMMVMLAANAIGRRSAARRVACAILEATLALAVLLLAFVWVYRGLLGVPPSLAAMRMLAGNAGQAVLHLAQSDWRLLALAVAGGVSLTWVTVWSVRRAAGTSPLRKRFAASLAFLLAGLGLVLSFTIATDVRAGAGAAYGSGFAPLFDPGHARPPQAAACRPVGPPVPLAPLPPPVGTAGRPPVIMILVEGLRADLLDAHRDAVPFLAELAKEGVRFTRAYGTSSHSDFSDLALWYARYPLRAEGMRGHPRDASWRGRSAFEYFHHHGYLAAYFSSQNERWGEMGNWLDLPVLDTFFDSERFSGATWENPDDDRGLAAMIRTGRATAGKVEDSRTLALAAQWAEQHAAVPFFVGLNLQNTHYSYVITEGGPEPFQPAELRGRRVYAGWPAEAAERVRNRYLNAAHNVDRALATFADRLRAAGIWDRAIVVVVGDNGEAFHEHGYGNHSGPMHDPVARTLAIVRYPGGDPRNGRAFTGVVSHIDLVPALVAAAGLPPWPGFQGRDPWVDGTGSPAFMTVNALVREHGIVEWPWKLLVRSFPAPTVELYDLAADPGERTNLADAMPHVRVKLEARIEAWRACQHAWYAPGGGHLTFQPPRYR